MNKLLPKSFCILPWVHTQIGIDGSILTCGEVTNNAKMSCKNDESLSDVWNNEKYKSIRQQFLNGEIPSQCDMCFKKESMGHESDRMKGHSWYSDYFYHVEQTQDDGGLPLNLLKSMDLRLSNICNFKCRTCGPEASSALAKDWAFLTKKKIENAQIRAFNHIQDFLDYMGDVLHQLEKIFFVGGEPFLMIEQFKLIESLNNAQKNESIELYYNTNLSVTKYGKTSIVEILKNYKSVVFNVSIDETHERGAYIREGFNWEVFKTNIRHFSQGLNNLRINYNITVSNINAYYLPDIIDTCIREFNTPPEAFILSPVLGPRHYALWNLTETAKERTLEKLINYQGSCSDPILKYRLEGIINFVKEESSTKELKAFKQITRRLDQVKGLSFQELFPELKELLD
jgi:MoaA/NifB/PqqE/SkfB family radical SAM enzyme